MSNKKSEGDGVLWRIIKPVKTHIYSAMILHAFGSVATIATLLLLSLVIAVLLNGGSLLFMGINWSLPGTLVGVGAVGLSAFILSSIAFAVSHLGAFELEVDLRTKLAEHMAQLPLGYIITNGTGSLKKVVLDDVKNLHVFVADSTPMIGRSFAAPVVSLILIFAIDWRLALIALSVLIVGMIMMSIAMKDYGEIRQEYDSSLGKINAAVIEFIQAMVVVRTFDDGTSSFKRYHKALESFQGVFIKWMDKCSSPSRLSMIIFGPLPTMAAVIAGGIFFISKGTLSVPTLVAMLFISTAMVDAFMPLMWLNNFLRKSKTAANRIEEILSMPIMSYAERGEVPGEMTIRFDEVDFSYENREEKALSGVSFTALPGTSTALVGPSGAGKSTVARLLPRFWDIDKGAITIGGVDIREMTSEDLMNTVTFVFQDTYLFHDTLANNIKMAKPDATDEEVVEAAKAAQIHDFIMELPEGYDTHAGERGDRLSGGQRQRITIARAILRNAPIVVLDEATAFADPESEEEIIKAISFLTRDKTVITIAHRLSSITHVDQILVFDKGEIVERGRHEELLANSGVYAGLWSNYQAAQGWDLHAKQPAGADGSATGSIEARSSGKNVSPAEHPNKGAVHV